MRTRRITLTVAIVFALGLFALPRGAATAQTLEERVAGMQTRRAAADPRRDTLQRMMRPVTIDLRESRLEDVMIFIEQVADVPLEVMWSADGAAGLNKDATVTLNIRNTSMLTMLERVLERVQDDFDPATWQLSPSGMLEVGPKSRLNRSAVLKIYDVSDMLFYMPNYTNVPELNLDTLLQQGGGGRGGGGGGGGIFQSQDDAGDFVPEEERAERLIDIITESVEPDQWESRGGSGATIRFHDGRLLIRAPDYIHRQIGGYPFWPQDAGASSGGGRRYVSMHGTVQGATDAGGRSSPVAAPAPSPSPNP